MSSAPELPPAKPLSLGLPGASPIQLTAVPGGFWVQLTFESRRVPFAAAFLWSAAPVATTHHQPPHEQQNTHTVLPGLPPGLVALPLGNGTPTATPIGTPIDGAALLKLNQQLSQQIAAASASLAAAAAQNGGSGGALPRVAPLALPKLAPLSGVAVGDNDTAAAADNGAAAPSPGAQAASDAAADRKAHV